MEAKKTGTVKFWVDGKGYGFIKGNDGQDYFIHYSGIMGGYRLKTGDKVSFGTIQKKGGLQANYLEKL